MELNRLLLKLVFLWHVNIQESSHKGNANFNFLERSFGREKGPGECILWSFREPKIQDFCSVSNRGAASGIY